MNSEAATLSKNPLKNTNFGHYLWCLLTERPESYLAMIACDTHTTKMYRPPKRVNKAIMRGKCPTTSPGLHHDRLSLRVGACLSWSLPLSCSMMNASPIRGSLITTVASKTSAGS